jgi:hypothetical protein
LDGEDFELIAGADSERLAVKSFPGDLMEGVEIGLDYKLK